MIETMYHEEGVGLVAPQVGILKRIAVVDVGEGVHVFINPEILEENGSCVDLEGCLSLLEDKVKLIGLLKIKVKALNEDGENLC